MTLAEMIAPWMKEGEDQPSLADAGPSIPRELGQLGHATSDSGTLVLEAIATVQGEHIAADCAAGYADAYARFALRHPNAFD